MSYRSEKSGVKVDELLDKIDALRNATQSTDGLMSNTDKQRLDDMTDVRALTFDEIDDVFNY